MKKLFLPLFLLTSLTAFGGGCHGILLRITVNGEFIQSVHSHSQLIGDTLQLWIGDTVRLSAHIDPLSECPSVTEFNQHLTWRQGETGPCDEQNTIYGTDSILESSSITGRVGFCLSPTHGTYMITANMSIYIMRKVNINPTGLSELHQISAVLFPNPTSDRVRIQTESSETFSYKISNMLGKEIIAGEFSKTTTIDLSGFPRGVYYLNAQNREGTIRKRIVLE